MVRSIFTISVYVFSLFILNNHLQAQTIVFETPKKGSYNVIDINGKGTFKVDKDLLKNTASKYFTPNHSFQNLIELLDSISALRDEIIEAINYQNTDALTMKERFAKAAELIRREENFAANLPNPYNLYYDTAKNEASRLRIEGGDVKYGLNNLFQKVSIAIDSIRSELLKSELFEFQLNAKHISQNNITDIHVENFDNISVSGYSVVPKYQFFPSNEKLEKLEAYQKINKLQFNNFSLADSKLQPSCLLQDTTLFQTEINNYNKALEAMTTSIRNLQFATLQNDIENALKALNDFEQNSGDTSQNCQIDDKKMLLEILESNVSLLKGTQLIEKSITDLSQQLRQYSLDEVPLEGYLDLKTVGSRQVGDQLWITAKIIKNGDEPDEQINYLILDKQYELIHRGFYVENDISFTLIKRIPPVKWP